MSARASGCRTRTFASVRADRPSVTSFRTSAIARRSSSSARSSSGCGQSLRWTESGASGDRADQVRVDLVGDERRVSGALSCATVTRHSHSVRKAACVSASAPDFQNRRRDAAHVPVREVVDETVDALRPPAVASKLFERVGRDPDRVVELGEDPAVHLAIARRAGCPRRRIEVFQRRVGDPERIRVPQRQQVLAQALFDDLGSRRRRADQACRR